jgi:hypothetical protein
MCPLTQAQRLKQVVFCLQLPAKINFYFSNVMENVSYGCLILPLLVDIYCFVIKVEGEILLAKPAIDHAQIVQDVSLPRRFVRIPGKRQCLPVCT